MSDKKINRNDIGKKVKKQAKETIKEKTQQSEELQKYFKEVNKTPSLSTEEENKLWKKIKEREGDEKLENRIFKANLKLVVSVVKKLIKKHPTIKDCLTLPELISIGKESLQNAIKVHRWHWDERKKKFSFYAIYGIKRAIFQAVLDKWLEEQRKKLFSPDENKELLLYGEKIGRVELIAKLYHRDKKIIIKAKNNKIEKELLREINQALQKEKYFSIPWHEETRDVISDGYLLRKLGDPGFLEVLKAEFCKCKSSFAPEKEGVGPEGVLANKKFGGYKIIPNLSRVIYK